MNFKLILLFLVFSVGLNSFAGFVNVPDMSKLKWQITPEGKVYFRNLNEFDSNYLSCCYNYYLDTTTPAGKSTWAVVLSKIIAGEPLSLGSIEPKTPGPVSYVGVH